MLRLARWLLNLALLASLALCAATLLLWAIAIPRSRVTAFEWRGHAFNCGVGGDRAWVVAVGNWPAGALRPGQQVECIGPPLTAPLGAVPGLQIVRGTGTVIVPNPQGYYSSQTHPLVTIILRLWLPPLVFGLLAILFGLPWWHLRRIPLRRARANLCPACGYNLTGNLSGVCPECGQSPGARRH